MSGPPPRPAAAAAISASISDSMVYSGGGEVWVGEAASIDGESEQVQSGGLTHARR